MDQGRNFSRTQKTILPFYPHQAYVFTFILSILFLFGLLANALVFCVIATSKLRKSVFNIFLISLCVSDFLSALFSPVFIYRRTWGYETFHIPRIICKLFFAVDQWTSVVTTEHIMLFSILRLIYVRWPRIFAKINRSYAKVLVSLLWVIGFLVGFIPFYIFCGIVEKNRTAAQTGSAWPACSLLISWIPAFKLYAYAGYPIIFYLPILCVCAISASLGLLLRNRARMRVKQQANQGTVPAITESRMRKDKQALVQLSLIVGSFLVGYVPHVAYHFYTTNNIHSTQYMRNVDWIFGMLEYSCLRFSECMNPVLYTLSSSKIRQQTILVITSCRRNRRKRLLRRQQNNRRGVDGASPSNQIALEITCGSLSSPST